MSPVSDETATFTYQVTYLNRAPVIVNTSSLTSIAEDIPSSDNPGDQVGQLALQVASDEDDDAHLGLAVIDADSSNGIWEYREPGTGWAPFPDILSPYSALLLPNSTWVRFTPDQHYFGDSSFVALAWDMSNGNTVVSNANTTSFSAFTGPFSTDAVSFSIVVSPVNDPPVVELSVAMVTFTESNPPDPVQIFQGNLTITDVDDLMFVSATVILECPDCSESTELGSGMIASGMSLTPDSNDMVLTQHPPMGFNSTLEQHDHSIVLLIEPSSGLEASMEMLVDYLHSLHFANVGNEPEDANRLVTLYVNDGVSPSGNVTVTIDIDLINDETPEVTVPVIEATFVEDQGPVLVFTSDPDISDPDDNSQFPLYGATLYLIDAIFHYEQLQVNCSGTLLTCTYNDSTGVLSIEGEAYVSEYENLLGQVMYDNVREEPDDADRMVTLTVFDGMFTSDPVSLPIHIQLINDQLPTLTLTSTIVELQEGLPQFQVVRIVPNATLVTVSDADNEHGDFPVESVEVSLLDPRDSNEGLRLANSGHSLIVSSENGNSTISISEVGGLRLMTLEDVLLLVEYFNFAEQPTGNDRTIQIIVYDNLTFVGSTPNEAVNVTVVLLQDDDPPFVRLMNEVIMYSEGQEPSQVPVAPDAEVGDLDNTDISGLLIELIPSDPSIDVSRELLAIGSLQPGISLMNSDRMLNLSGTASLDAYTATLRSLTYEHTETFGDPDSGQRVIRVTPLDLDEAPGASDEVIIAFTAVPNCPIVDLNGVDPGRNYATMFIEESLSPVPLVSDDFVLIDVDTDDLLYIEIALSPSPDDEFIAVNSTLANDLGIDVVVNSSSLLRLEGQPTAAIEHFRDVLSTLVYFNGADEPEDTPRNISVVASDGTVDCTGQAYAIVTVNIMLVNDPPFLTVSTNQNFSTQYSENGDFVYIAPTPQIHDPDSSLMRSLTVRAELSQPGDVIGGLPNPGDFRVAFDVPRPVSEVESLLSNLTFSSNNSEPAEGARIYCISVMDTSFAESNEVCTTINVKPVNDNRPVFDSPSYSASVAENAAGVPVIQVTARDADAANSIVTLVYDIISGDDCHNEFSGASGTLFQPECTFRINAVTGEITTNMDSPPDREVRDSYTLIVSVTDGLFENTTVVEVMITDVNDNLPCFDPTTYNATIPLGEMPGYIIANLSVQDPDQDERLSLLPMAVSGPSSMNAFVLDADNFGVVILGIPESSVEPGVYVIEYEALDSIFQPSKNRASLEITVISNVEVPRFDQPAYTALPVSESVPVGTPVITVHATDGDQGSHGEITYTLSTASSLPLAINDTTGEITVSDSLDFEQQEEYMFTVVAYDNGRPESFSNTTQVTVQLTDVNDNVPIFTEPTYSASICEGAPAGTTLVTVVAEDQDSGEFGEVIYSILDLSLDCGDCVSLNATTGDITATTLLDFEQYPSINLIVLAMDAAGRGFENAGVTITVLNDNEHSPQFQFEAINITISENYSVGAPLPIISMYEPLATDDDDCDVDQCNGEVVISNASCIDRPTVLTYAIQAGNEDGFFSIDSSSSILTLSSSLDIDMSSHRWFSLTISVTDGQFNDTALVSIEITDSDEHPTVFENAFYNVTISENTPIGTPVIQVTAVDQDRTAVISYSITGTNAEDFAIDPVTGEITTAQALDFESVSEYRLMLVATDQETDMNGFAYLNIQLMDINDNAPTLTEPTSPLSVTENNPLGMELALLEATDPDFAAVIHYTIIQVTPGDTTLFEIVTRDVVSVFLTANVSFDFEEDAVEYSVVIEAEDSGSPSLSSNLTITVRVQDANDNSPQFSEPQYEVDISENANIEELVLQLEASDRDSGDNGRLSFVIESGNDLDTFSLNFSTGALTLSAALDYETVTSYTLRVVASDFGVVALSSDVQVYIVVVDENDNPPVFDMDTYEAEIHEHSAEHTFIVEVRAVDADTGSNAEIRFTFEESLVDNPFAIDPESGIITVANSVLLDRETSPSLQFTVIAFNPNDAEGDNATTSVVVTLLDVNDNPPMFSRNTFVAEVGEDFTPGLGSEGIQPLLDLGDLGGSGSGSGDMYGSVVTVTAEDLDDGINSEFTFAIVGGSGEDFFGIDAQTGAIFATTSLDRETEDFYQLRIQATDRGVPSLSATAYVNITITDVNDNVPQFLMEPYISEVLENRPAETNVLQVVASDLDSGSNALVVYSISPSAGVPFYIDPSSGWIRTTESLDRELESMWSFTVEASDNGTLSYTSSTAVSITVLDENDNPPVISPAEIRHTVLENAAVGTVIQVFEITDMDAGENAEVSISLRGQPSAFAINSSGALIVSGLLDYEAQTEYNFSVVVENVAPPHHSAIADITIELENENDNPPIVHFGVDDVPYFEKTGRLTLDVGITIMDADGRNVTRLLDGIVEFTNLSPLEPSFPYVPTTQGQYIPYDDYNCYLEDKVQKVENCGIQDPEFVTESSLVDSHHLVTVGLDTDDIANYTLLFDASEQQYAHISLDVTHQSGLTISTWIWVEPSSSRSTILAKVRVNDVLYGLYCSDNSSLEFQYLSDDGSLDTVTFPDVCSQLQNAWHHLAVVVDCTDPSKWQVNVYVDGEYTGTSDISQFTDDDGILYMGAYSLAGGPARDFFSGRIHLLVISNSVAHGNSITCLTGCGIAFISSIAHETPLTHSYNFTSRTLNFEGRQEISVYEQFLNSLIMVIPFTEPRVNDYTLSYTVQDEYFNCLPTSIVIIIVPQNDFVPELSLNGATSVDFSTVFVEEGGPVAAVNRSSFFLTDMDFIQFPYTIRVEILEDTQLQPVGEEILAVTNIPMGMNVTYEHYILTLTGELSLSMYEDVLRTLTYDNAADEPSGEHRRLMITVSDNPMPDVMAYVNITFVFVNDPPEVDITSRMVQYREEDGTVLVLESVSIVDSDNTTLVSASISFTAPDGDMETISVDTSTSSIHATYDPSTGTLILEGEDTLENYTSVLQSLSYIHESSTDPTGGTRVFNVTVFDGIDYSEQRQAVLFFEAVNDIPVLDLNGPEPGFDYEVDFIEDTDTIISVISPEATLTDVDSTTLTYLNISLSPTPDGAFETLIISILSGSGLVTVHNATDFELLPQAGVIISDFLTDVRTLQYRNLAEEPTEGTRTIEFIASDGEDQSIPVFTTVTVVAVNDAPVLDLDPTQLGYQVAYTEGGPAVPITSGVVTITDNDHGAVITELSIVILNVLDGTDEVIESNSPNITVPVPGPTSNSLTYTFTPSDSSPAYAAEVLASLTYRNLRDEPTGGNRLIQVAVSDGNTFSNSELVTLTVETVNDHPPVFSQTIFTGVVAENQPPGTSAGRVVAVDMDNGPDGEISFNITSTDPAEGLSYFEVQSSGEVLTSSPLDREEVDMYVLTVIAMDAGNPPQTSAPAFVTITIQDVNDVTPTFVNDTQLQLSVSESRGIGYVVETLRAVDGDLGFNAAVEFLMGGTGSDSPFGVDLNGNIVVEEELDADAGTTMFNISVIVQDRGSPRLSSDEVFFVITVLDENDNHPQFTQSVYEVLVPENQTVPFTVVTVEATDGDSTVVNSNITYAFVDPITATSFAINSVTGTITSLIPFDRELQSSYTFEVEASDGTFTNTSTVLVRVGDENDNPPVFSQTLYEGQVSENALPGTMIMQLADTTNSSAVPFLQVAAMDVDEGSNGDFLFSIQPSGQVMPMFSLELTIDSVTGDISVAEHGDFEIQQEANFTVIATDRGMPPQTGVATLRVYLVDENDNPPIFEQSMYQAQVPENEAGYNLIQVGAVDLDSFQNGEIRYFLLNEQDSFAIDPESGQITTRVELDFETTCFYRLVVLAEDQGQPTMNSTAVVEVLVDPLHDVPPSFQNDTSYVRSICENLPQGTSVLQVSAFDGDLITCTEAEQQIDSGSGVGDLLLPEYSPIEYSLLTHGDTFAIDNSSGVITTLVVLDRELNSQYRLTVLATDLGGFSVEANVTVNVIDKNDNRPYFLQSTYSASVSENTPDGTPVLHVLAVDPDMLDEGRLTYSLLGNPEFLDIDSQTGVISVSGAIDFEMVDQTVVFSARVNDTSSQFDTAIVSITISDENDLPPTIETLPQMLVFMEGQVSLRPFPEIEVTDPDSFQRLCSADVQLTSPQMENSEGVTQCSCSNATDEASCSPGCLEFLQIPNDSFPGVITQSINNFSLTLEGNFSIETYEAAILSIEYINTIFNPTPENRHISLSVFDCQLPSNTLTQPIEVRLLNVFRPVLTLDPNETVFTERGDPIPIVPGNVSIMDEDTAREVQELTSIDIWITNPSDGNLESIYLPYLSTLPQSIEYFVHSSHNVTLTGAAPHADYEAALLLLRYVNTAEEPDPTRRIINLVAHEYFLSSEVVTVTITFKTFNDHPPIIITEPPDQENSRTSYTEGTVGERITAADAFIVDDDSTNDTVIELSVNLLSSPSQYDYIYFDGDLDDSITFERLSNVSLMFTGEAASTNYDVILRNLFYQYTGDEFESLSPPKYIFLQVADSAMSSFSVVQIDLEPVNDQMPVFLEDSYRDEVPESTSTGHSLLAVEATDNDRFSDADIVYSITSGNDDDLFTISSTNGTIYLSQPLDFESTPIHRLIVEARDQNFAGHASILPGTAVVTIVVGDDNEHIPMFDTQMYNASIAEGVAVGTTVLQVNASDADGDLHSQLVFEIIGSDDFVIGRTSGIISTNTDIDREVTTEYSFAVRVNNPGSTDFDVALVFIYVLDLDDNPPQLSLSPASGILQEPETTATLANMLQITDTDPIPPSLDFAIVQILPDSTPAPGYLLSLVQSESISVSGNNTEKLIFIGLSRSLSEYEEVLRGVIYVDLADEPEDIQRVIAYQVGSNVVDPSMLDYSPSDTVSNVTEFTVAVQLINDQAPEILLDTRDLSTQNLTLPGCETPGSFSTTFAEDGPPTALSHSSLTVTDLDSGENLIYSAVVAILDVQEPGLERLTFQTGSVLSIGDGTTDERIVLEGPATAEEFVSVLRSIR